MGVREELYAYRKDLKPEHIDRLIENGDLLEEAEWNSRDQGQTELTFYQNSRMYLWNQVQAEEARLRGGDFERMLSYLPKPKSKKHGVSVLDFGAGIGSAGLFLNDHPDACGYVPYFLEICTSSRDFLDFRRKNRTLYGRMVHPEESWKNAFDLVIAYAVFEHMNTDTLYFTLKNIKNMLREDGTLFMVNYHDTFGGRWPMHHLMSPGRKDLFEEFGKERRVIAPLWEEMEGEIAKSDSDQEEAGKDVPG